jgi:hypothetical protein
VNPLPRYQDTAELAAVVNQPPLYILENAAIFDKLYCLGKVVYDEHTVQR